MLGTSNGTFQDERYFVCKDGYGLFVPLNKLVQQPPAVGWNYMYGRQNSQPALASSVPISSMGGYIEDSTQNTRSKSITLSSRSRYCTASPVGEYCL